MHACRMWDRSQCSGPAFRAFERRMLQCEVWTLTKPLAAIDIETVTELEDRIQLANPRVWVGTSRITPASGSLPWRVLSPDIGKRVRLPGYELSYPAPDRLDGVGGCVEL